MLQAWFPLIAGVFPFICRELGPWLFAALLAFDASLDPSATHLGFYDKELFFLQEYYETGLDPITADKHMFYTPNTSNCNHKPPRHQMGNNHVICTCNLSARGKSIISAIKGSKPASSAKMLSYSYLKVCSGSRSLRNVRQPGVLGLVNSVSLERTSETQIQTTGFNQGALAHRWFVKSSAKVLLIDQK